MKAHVGVDAQSGLAHTVECTTAKVADITMMEQCLHAEEVLVLGDRGYHKRSRTVSEELERESGRLVLTPSKRPKGGKLTEYQKCINRALSALRAKVEHSFRVLKRQFGYVKVRYRGLVKNAAQIMTLFALGNLWQARHRLLASTGEVRPWNRDWEKNLPYFHLPYFLMNGCKLRKFNPFWLKNDKICLGFNFSCRKDTLIRQSLVRE